MLNPFLNWLADALGKMKRPALAQPLPLDRVLVKEAQSFPELMVHIGQGRGLSAPDCLAQYRGRP